MRRSRPAWHSATRRTCCKRLAAVLLALLCLALTGCQSRAQRDIVLKGTDVSFDLSPCRQASGEPFHIAIVDQAPPIESSYLWLLGLAEGFQSAGYLPESLDFSAAPQDFDGLYYWLVNQDLGEYIAFDTDYYLVDAGMDDQIADTLRREAQTGQLQAVAASGTLPGQFLKELELGVPLLVCLATDPVASGIIDSVEDTGNPDIWALVEPDPSARQFDAFYSTLQFQRLGLVSVSEYDIIAGNNEYRKMAKERGVELREVSVTEDETFSDNYTEILLDRLSALELEGLDGVLFAFGALSDAQVKPVEEVFSAKGIPMLVADGDSLVREGVMMCLSCYDYEGYGRYASMVLSNVFHGERAGDQPCSYISSPHIVLNMTTADKLGFETGFDLLRSADMIVR